MTDRTFRRRWQIRTPCGVFFCLSLACCNTLAVSTNNVRLVVDIRSSLRGESYHDEQAASVGPHAVGVLFDALGEGFPERIGIDALIVYSNRVVFSTDVDFSYEGSDYADEDLVEFNVNSGTVGIYFDGSAQGVPSSADLDAAAMVHDGQIRPETLRLSFDKNVVLPAAGSVSDDDIVGYDGGVFSVLYRGTDLGIPTPADVDALYESEDNLYFSLDTTATIDGGVGSDEDVWVLNKGSGDVSLLGKIGMEPKCDLAALDMPLDSDGDWLSDFEEASGLDEAATTYPGTGTPLGPNGHKTHPLMADTDGDGIGDGGEAACGTNPRDEDDNLHIIEVTVMEETNAVVRWASVSGKHYALDATSSIEDGFTNEVAGSVWGVAGTNATAYTNSNSDNLVLYSVRLIQ